MIWPQLKFEELFAAPLRNGVYKPKQFHGRGQKMVNMGELFAYDFLSNQEMRRIELNDREKKNSLLRAGDLLFARRSLVLEGSGKCSLVTGTEEDTTFESSIIRARLNQAEAHPKFYFYFFGSPQGRALMASIASQTAVSGITGSNLALLKVPHPSLSSQLKIAIILSAYDDLIENNMRRIQILEEMARRIYEEWFVRFRFPGYEKVRMIESQLGLIPEGWKIDSLASALVLQRGFDLPVANRRPGQYPVFAATGINGTHSEAKVKAPGIVTGRSGSLGIVNFIDEDFWPLNTTLWVREFRRVSAWYAFYLLGDMRLEQYNSGAAVPTLNRNDIHGLPVLIPSRNILNQFDSMVMPIFRFKRILNRKNNILRRTRDLLIPKLISGEIDVSNFPEPVTD